MHCFFFLNYSSDAACISFFPTFVSLFCVENILKQFFSNEFTLGDLKWVTEVFHYGLTNLTFSYLTADTETGNVDSGRVLLRYQCLIKETRSPSVEESVFHAFVLEHQVDLF